MTKIKGLTEKEVEESRRRNGSNIIPNSEPTTFWDEFKETFSDPMIKILLVIVIVMIAMFALGYAEIYEPIGTIVAILIVAFVTAKTGVASDTKYRELKESTEKDTCKVYRNGEIDVILVDDVVVGDKVLLQAGDKIPADGILIDGELKVNNSALNGEAEECLKTNKTENIDFPEEITGEVFVDESSLFRGAVIFDGEGVMDVRKVGMSSMMGKMAEDMQDDEPDSPLKVKLGKLANHISVFGYISAIIIAVLYMVYHVVVAGGIDAYIATGWANILEEIIQALSVAILIVVCAVPEGLPLMISLVLMQNTSKMLDHNVLVRKAEGIETAGSLNILFSDKTGTITKGSLEVVEFFTADSQKISLEEIKNSKIISENLNIAIAKNTASKFDSKHEVVGGNATDQALMKMLGEEVFNSVSVDDKYKAEKSQGFNSVNKFSQVYIESMGRTYYKGAPEKILEYASKAINTSGEVIDIDKNALELKINELAQKAMRVLAFGYSEKALTENRINEDVIIIGLVAIRDDVRSEAREAISQVQDAGIQVIMITGDRLETAVAIAKDAGLLTTDRNLAISSTQLNRMNDDEVKKIIKDIRVIARALPTDKSRMVRLCQEENIVVGMTGDGVNDSAALKRADVGFAMGSGTEAAKEAGDIVIIDDNFKSIKDAILYGRTIFRNILKFCKFQLVINVAAVFVSAIGPFFGIIEPLKVTHLLFVNLVMDSLGAIMLGNEPADEEYMREKPIKRDANIINSSMFSHIATMGIWLTVMSFCFFKIPFFDRFFCNETQKYTAYFVLFIWSALFNGFNVRDDGFSIFRNLNQNKSFMRVWLIIALVQALIVNAAIIPLNIFEWIGEMFSCTPFNIQGWLVVIGLAITMIPIDLARKWLLKGSNTKSCGVI